MSSLTMHGCCLGFFLAGAKILRFENVNPQQLGYIVLYSTGRTLISKPTDLQLGGRGKELAIRGARRGM